MNTLKTKLTSRKLWAAILAIVATLFVALFRENIPTDVADLVGKGVLALCVYIFGEAGVDIARIIWNAATEKAKANAETVVQNTQTATTVTEATAVQTDNSVYIGTNKPQLTDADADDDTDIDKA